MNKIEYSCICYDIRGDITYCAEATNFDDAVNKVNYYRKLIENPNTNKLSQAALETLAIIAYNEPITRVSIDVVRYQVDENTGDTIDGTWKVLRTFAIEGE